MPVSSSVALVGAFDTKAPEYAFVRDRLATAGVSSVLIDTGVLGSPGLAADIPRSAVASAGGADLVALASAGDRNAAMIAMADGAASIVRGLVADVRVGGVLVLGGSNAAFIMARVAAALPIGIPKMLVSTAVAGDTTAYVGTADLTMMYPVEDIAGLNSLSAPLLARAADAIAGMTTGPPLAGYAATGPAIALTMFGITTAGVTAARDELERGGREPHVFHANGQGGRTLEALVRSGLFDAVVDLTTTELADELVGGICSAGPGRLTAAGARGIPQVVSLGALDVVNFGALDTLPDRHRARRLHPHNPFVTLMRTEPDECAELGRILAERLNASTGYVEVHAPAEGFSQLSVRGGPFHHPAADAALIDALERHLDERIPFVVHPLDINDPRFATQIVTALDRALAHTKGTPT